MPPGFAVPSCAPSCTTDVGGTTGVAPLTLLFLLLEQPTSPIAATRGATGSNAAEQTAAGQSL